MTAPGLVGLTGEHGRTVGGPLHPTRRSASGLVAPAEYDLIRIVLVSLMAVSIARVHTFVPGISVLRPGLLLTFLALVLAIALPGKVTGGAFLSTWPVRRVGVLLLLACVGLPFGLGAGASFTVLTESWMPNLVFAGLLVVATRRAGDLRLLIWSYVGSMGVLVYQSLFVWGSNTFNGFQRTASTVMYDPNDLGALLAAALPLAILVAQTSKGVVRIAAYTCAAAIPGSVAVLGTRGGFIALIVSILGVLAMMPRMTWGKRFGVVGVVVLAMAAFAPPGYLMKMNTIVNPGDDYNVTSETGRLAIWKRGMANLAPRPLTGVGIGNFARAQWVNQQFTEAGAPIRAQSAHNTFLQVAVDLGVPAFLVFFSIVFSGTVGIARMRTRLPVSWLKESAERRFLYLTASYLPVAFVGWAAGAFFVSHAYLAPFYIFSAFTAGFLYLLRRELRRAGPATAAPRRASRRLAARA